MNAQQERHVSKFLSLVLRHRPDMLGTISLDANGWTKVDDLLAAMNRHGQPITLDELKFVVANNDKKRFAFNEDGTKIRASQGHSVKVDLDLTPVVPPPVLFHGTSYNNLGSIREKGLLKMERNYVHLTDDYALAVSQGKRSSNHPIVLRIDSETMRMCGIPFYQSDNGVWLTGRVPSEFITLNDPLPTDVAVNVVVRDWLCGGQQVSFKGMDGRSYIIDVTGFDKKESQGFCERLAKAIPRLMKED